jgi:hypothetical protein
LANKPKESEHEKVDRFVIFIFTILIIFAAAKILKAFALRSDDWLYRSNNRPTSDDVEAENMHASAWLRPEKRAAAAAANPRLREIEGLKCQLVDAEKRATRYRLASDAAETANKAVSAELRKARMEIEDFRRALAQINTEQEQLKSRLAEAAAKKPSGGPTEDKKKFRRAKVFLGKSLHPNNFPGITGDEKMLREKIFKEIWPQLERIEHEA